jgi:hypothetical protein
MLKDFNFENFLNKIGENLNMNIDPSSLDVKIFRCFYDLTKAITTQTEAEIKSMFFENLEGEDLDNVMEFFDTHRTRGGDSDIHVFKLYGRSTKNFLIKKSSILNFENKSFRVLTDTYINNGENDILTQVITGVETIEKPVFTNDGNICFDNIALEASFDNYNQEFTNTVKFTSYYIQSDEVESDFEFKERSKSLMQSLGYSNSQKIKNELIKNSDIKNVTINEKDDITLLTVIPKDLSKSDEIIESSIEIVNYYKGGNVVVQKPNVLEVNLEGVNTLLVFDKNERAIKEAIAFAIVEHLNSNFTGVVYRSKIISLIQEVVNANSEIHDYDVNTIEVNYSFYSKKNYETPIVLSTITNYKTITEETVVSFGRVG